MRGCLTVAGVVVGLAVALPLWFTPLKPGTEGFWYPCSGAVPVVFGDRVPTFEPPTPEEEDGDYDYGPGPHTMMEGGISMASYVDAAEANAACRKAALRRLIWSVPLGLGLVAVPIFISRRQRRSDSALHGSG